MTMAMDLGAVMMNEYILMKQEVWNASSKTVARLLRYSLDTVGNTTIDEAVFKVRLRKSGRQSPVEQLTVRTTKSPVARSLASASVFFYLVFHLAGA